MKVNKEILQTLESGFITLNCEQNLDTETNLLSSKLSCMTALQGSQVAIDLVKAKVETINKGPWSNDYKVKVR